MAKRRNPKKFFYNMVTVISIVFILVMLYFMFFNKGVKAPENKAGKPTAVPTEVVATQEPVITSEELLGKWKLESGYFISFSKDKVKMGVSGLESEADTYSYSIDNNKLTINFKEGHPMKDASWSVDGDKLTIDYGYDKDVFVKD